MANALIVCRDNWNSIAEVPYLLKKGGFKVDVFCGPTSWLLKNSFYDRWIPAPKDNTEFMQQLEETVLKNGYDLVVQGDEKALKLANEFISNESLFYKLLPLTKIGNRAVISSKTGFSEICDKYGLPTPAFLIYSKENGDNELEDLKYPLIAKTDFSWGGTGVKLCKSRKELEDFLLPLKTTEKVVLQEYIKGKEVPVEAFYWEGQLLEMACADILEYDKDEFTYSTRRRYYKPDNAFRCQVEEAGAAIGIHGFVNMAFMRAEVDGRYYLIETDLRPTSWVAYTKFTGNPLWKALRKVSEQPITGRALIDKDTEIALFHKDIRRALYKHDIKGVLRWLFKPAYWRFVPFYDRKLLSAILKDMWKEFVVEKTRRSFMRK